MESLNSCIIKPSIQKSLKESNIIFTVNLFENFLIIGKKEKIFIMDDKEDMVDIDYNTLECRSFRAISEGNKAYLFTFSNQMIEYEFTNVPDAFPIVISKRVFDAGYSPDRIYKNQNHFYYSSIKGLYDMIYDNNNYRVNNIIEKLNDDIIIAENIYPEYNYAIFKTKNEIVVYDFNEQGVISEEPIKKIKTDVPINSYTSFIFMTDNNNIYYVCDDTLLNWNLTKNLINVTNLPDKVKAELIYQFKSNRNILLVSESKRLLLILLNNYSLEISTIKDYDKYMDYITILANESNKKIYLSLNDELIVYKY